MKKIMEVGRRPSGEYDGKIKFSLETNKINVWGCSSVGRAPVLQAGGQRFDPANLHQDLKLNRSI